MTKTIAASADERQMRLTGLLTHASYERWLPNRHRKDAYAADAGDQLCCLAFKGTSSYDDTGDDRLVVLYHSDLSHFFFWQMQPSHMH